MFESVQSLFAYILAQVESKEGRNKEWYGYTQYEKDATAFDMENEDDGERLSIFIQDNSWRGAERKSYAILVTKKFIIYQDEEGRSPSYGSPTDEDQVNTLISFVCKLHGSMGLHTLFANKEAKELEELRAKIEAQDRTIKHLRSTLDAIDAELDAYDSENVGW